MASKKMSGTRGAIVTTLVDDKLFGSEQRPQGNARQRKKSIKKFVSSSACCLGPHDFCSTESRAGDLHDSPLSLHRMKAHFSQTKKDGQHGQATNGGRRGLSVD